MDLADVRRSRGYHIAVGAGLVSYGLIHLVLAWIAIQVAAGRKGDASQTGALTQLAKQPLGTALLWIMAIGLFTLTIWQVLEATIGREQSGRDGRLRRRLSSAGRAIVYLALGILTVAVAKGSGSQSGKGEETISAKLMAVPFGQVLVGAIGLAVIAVGVSQIVKGVKQNFTEDLAPVRVRAFAGSASSATAPRASRCRSSACCSAGRRSPTTRRRPAAWTQPCPPSATSRSARCCW